MRKRNALLALALWAAQAFAQPAPEAAAPPAPAPEPTWSELLAARQHAELEQRMAPLLEAGRTDLAKYRELRRALAALVASPPQTSDRFDEWVAATASGIAHLTRAEFHMRRAWQARGNALYRETHPDAIARMKQLLPLARTDHEAALAKIGPRCDLCYAGLIEGHLALGEREQIAALVDKAIQALDGGIATPRMYLVALEPRWGGSDAESQRFIDRFAADGRERAAIPLLRAAMLVERSQALNRQHKPEQALVVSQQAASIDPGNSRAWERVAADAMDLDRLPLVLEATQRALEIDPTLAYALNARAHALLRGPAPLQAVPFLERAVAKGDEWALKALLPIVAAGQHGFKPDRERAQRICQSAIDALVAAGFACMGGLEYFGMGRPADKPRALQWFLEASERGVTVAMVDAAKMLLRGDGVPPDRDRAIALLLKARAAGEPRAEAMLRGELSTVAYVQRVQLPELQGRATHKLQDNRAQTRVMIAIGCMLLGSTFWGFLYKAGAKPAHRLGRKRILRAGWPLRLLAIANLAVVLAGFWFVRYAAPMQRLWGLAALGLFLLAALYLLYAVFLTQVWFEDGVVHFESPLRGHVHIAFPEVVDLRWSPLAQCDYIESVHGERIYVSAMLEGSEELFQTIDAWQQRGRAAPA